MVPEVGSAPTSPPLQGGANLPQLVGVKMVVRAGNAPASTGYQPGALLLSYRTRIELGGALFGTPPGRVYVSIQERHLGHCSALGLRAHDHPMPERQRDGFMIDMTHGTTGVNTRVPAHHLPAPAGSARGSPQETLVLCRCDPVRVPGAHVNSFPACAEDLLDQVRLTRTATKRFIV